MKTLRNISFGLGCLITITLTAATITERFATIVIYDSVWMAVLWALFTTAATIYLICRHAWLTPGTTLLHIAFIIILIGAAITHFHATEGKITLYTDGPPADIYLDAEGRFHPLPAEIGLDSTSPEEARSRVIVTRNHISRSHTLSVNHPLSIDGMRIYLLHTGSDRASLLITDDLPGITVTYTGYILLALSVILIILYPPHRREHIEKPFTSSLWLIMASGGLLALQTTAIVVKWAIFRRPPMTDGGQALQIMAWTSLVVAVATSRRWHIIASAALSVGAILMIAGILAGTWLRSNPLIPALDSPLLALHVVTVMSAYALFAVMTVVSVWGVISRSSSVRSAAFTRSLALPAVLLLCAGIFIGAVWANQAWGRYWGWDPKETWALVTLLVYALPFHTRSFPSLGRPSVTNTYYLLAFITVVITYFGVNYLLGGLHSYV